MATRIQIKRSTVSGVTPTTSDITIAELGVNLADRKLFTSNGSVVVELGSNLTNLSVSGNATISGLIANGSLGSAGQVLSSNGTVAYWATPSVSAVTSVATGNGLTGGPITSTGTISVLANTGVTANATGIHIGQAVGTSSSVQFGSLGVGTAASGTTGEIRATNNITAYYSDKRLKDVKTTIPNALEKVLSISGVYYTPNDTAKFYGYTDESLQVGVIAQDVENILPEVIKLAPFDTEYIDGKEQSKSGENYKTVQYEKLIPLLIEAIKEQQQQILDLKAIISKINSK